MKLASRLVQSLILIAATPFLWAFGILTYTAVMLAQTATAVGKVWR
jgi:hypothetical protein